MLSSKVSSNLVDVSVSFKDLCFLGRGAQIGQKYGKDASLVVLPGQDFRCKLFLQKELLQKKASRSSGDLS